jgi:hypothetical protein
MLLNAYLMKSGEGGLDLSKNEKRLFSSLPLKTLRLNL